MAIRDTWRRSLEYFGLVEGDYIEEGEYDEGDTGSEMALDPSVAPREPVRGSASRRGRGREEDIDDIFGDDQPAPRRGRIRSVDDTAEEPQPSRGRGRRRAAGAGAWPAPGGGWDRWGRRPHARRHAEKLQRRPAGRRRVQALQAGDHQSP